MSVSVVLPSGLNALRGFRIALFYALFVSVAGASAHSQVVYRVDFAGQPGVSTYSWLEDRNFLLEHDAKEPSRIRLQHYGEALHIQVNQPSFGLLIHEQDVPDVNHVHLHWGVSSYPEGASYEQGVDNEAIMVYVFFGHEKLPSGSLIVPDSPYFIGFFLCPPDPDELEQPYVGHHYKKTGRYICVDHPPAGQKVVTQLDLESAFRKSFGLDFVPMVSGFSIEVDTTDSLNDGKAAAFVQRIEFLKQE